MTKLHLIILAAIVYVFGFFSGCIFPKDDEPIKVDKHELENKSYERKMDSILILYSIHENKFTGIEKRLSTTDSLISKNHKKGNEAKNNFHRSNLSLWNDSVLRANNLK